MNQANNFVASLKYSNISEIVSALTNTNRPKFRHRLVILNEIAPSDLYCYLYARFGAPNGMQNILRKDHSDNLIHWDWTLRGENGWVSFLGLNFRTEIWVTSDVETLLFNERELAAQIKADFSQYGKNMSELRKNLEMWTEFANPYRRIKKSINKLLGELRELNLRPEDEQIPNITCSKEIPEDGWGELFSKYTHGLGLCFGIRSMLPVMAEAFVNLILFVLMRPDLKSDIRLRENTVRQAMDVRVKSLHISCQGFEHGIDYSNDVCKAYHSLVNERNDLLHGNVAIEKLKFNEVFFNGNVPIFKQYKSMWERSVGVEIQSVGLHRLEKEVEIVDNFIRYLKGCMKSSIREDFERVAESRDLGLNEETGRIGILFPDHLVDFFPIFDKDLNNRS